MSADDAWKFIDNEFLKMQQALDKNKQFLDALDETQYNSVLYDGLIGSIAMNLQSFYTGAERILLKIAREIDESVPRGEHWHKALLEQMAIDTDLRPVVLGEETFSALEELRSFRHFVRNAYSYTLDAQRVIVIANLLTRCHDNLFRDCQACKQTLT